MFTIPKSSPFLCVGRCKPSPNGRFMALGCPHYNLSKMDQTGNISWMYGGMIGNNMNIPSRERNITKFSLESTGQVDTKGKLMFHPNNFVRETHFFHLSRKKCARSTDEVPLYRPRLGTTIPRIAGKFTATPLYLI